MTEAMVHDMNAMDIIPYEENAFYILNRDFNDFKRIHNNERVSVYFVVSDKKWNDSKPMKWTIRISAGSGIFSDCMCYMNGPQTKEKYPDKKRRIINWD